MPFTNAAQRMRRRSPGPPILPIRECEIRPLPRCAGGDIANPAHSDPREVDSGLGESMMPSTHVSQRRKRPGTALTSESGRKGQAVAAPTHSRILGRSKEDAVRLLACRNSFRQGGVATGNNVAPGIKEHFTNAATSIISGGIPPHSASSVSRLNPRCVDYMRRSARSSLSAVDCPGGRRPKLSRFGFRSSAISSAHKGGALKRNYCSLACDGNTLEYMPRAHCT